MNSHDWMALLVQITMVVASFFGARHGTKTDTTESNKKVMM